MEDVIQQAKRKFSLKKHVQGYKPKNATTKVYTFSESEEYFSNDILDNSREEQEINNSILEKQQIEKAALEAAIAKRLRKQEQQDKRS